MPFVQIFDPPSCCATGSCGSQVDTSRTQFAADLEWLKSQGVEVERFNLAHDPSQFAQHAVVQDALQKQGERCLPLILVDREIVSEGRYPSREELAVLAAVAATGVYTRAVEELVAISAALGANCDSCLAHHVSEAIRVGVSRDDIARALATARQVKEAALREISKSAGRLLASAAAEESLKVVPCCTPDVTPIQRKRD
jgi:AhpD family alkylhydroperoxidase